MLTEENKNPEETKTDEPTETSDEEIKDPTSETDAETESAVEEDVENVRKPISPAFWLTAAAAIVGVVVVVAFISAMMKLKVNYQQEEAVQVLELIGDKMQSSSYFKVLEGLKEGTDMRLFSASIGISPADIAEGRGLKYHLLGDFVYHKGGKDGTVFYIEAKSSLDKPVVDMLEEAPETSAEINKELIVRLFSDGTIETIN